MSATKKRDTYLESLLKVLGRKIIFYVFILIFISKINLVISLNDWLTLGALAADKNCIHITILSRSSKSTERPKEKKKNLFGKIFESARRLGLVLF